MKWNPSDIIAIILTIAVSFILILSILSPLITGTTLSDSGRELIGKIIFALIAIVSMYIGSQINNKE